MFIYLLFSIRIHENGNVLSYDRFKNMCPNLFKFLISYLAFFNIQFNKQGFSYVLSSQLLEIRMGYHYLLIILM